MKKYSPELIEYVKDQIYNNDLGELSDFRNHPDILLELAYRSGKQFLESYKKNLTADANTGGFNWSQSEETQSIGDN